MLDQKSSFLYNEVKLRDCLGNKYNFTITKVLKNDMIYFYADQIDGDFIIAEKGFTKDLESNILAKLLIKIENTINYKTIEGQKLKRNGTMRLVKDSNQLSFVIDGRKYNATEIANYFSNYTDKNINFSITDITEPIVNTNHSSDIVNISPSSVLYKYEQMISSFAKNLYLDPINEIHCLSAFSSQLNVLKTLQKRSPFVAKAIAELMIEDLKSIKSTSTSFPNDIIERINDIFKEG